MTKALGADYVGNDPDDPFGSGRTHGLRREMLGPHQHAGDIGGWIAGIGGLLIVAFYVAVAVGFVWWLVVPHHAAQSVVRPAPRTEHVVNFEQYLKEHGGSPTPSGTVPAVCNAGTPGGFAAYLAAGC